MPKMFPSYQKFFDLSDGTSVAVTQVTLINTTNPNFFVLGQTEDVRVLLASGQTLPTFYMGGAAGNPGVVNVDAVAGNVGQQFTFVSRHRGHINFIPNQ